MQATEVVAGEIRAELARRRMGVQAFAETLKDPESGRTVFSFRTLCRRLAEPGTFTLDELFAVAAFFDYDDIAELVSPVRRAA